MEIKQITSKISQNYSHRELLKLTTIRKATDSLLELIDDFVFKYDIEIDEQSSLYVLIVPHDGNMHIVGIIKINPNDFRSQFKFEENSEKYVFHEFTSIVLDENLFDFSFLKDCF